MFSFLSEQASACATLSIGGKTVAPPVAVQDPKALFEELGKTFHIDEQVIKYLLETVNVKSLLDFHSLIGSVGDVESVRKWRASSTSPWQ